MTGLPPDARAHSERLFRQLRAVLDDISKIAATRQSLHPPDDSVDLATLLEALDAERARITRIQDHFTAALQLLDQQRALWREHYDL